MRNKYMRISLEWDGIGLMALVTFIPRPLQTGSHWPQIGHSLYWTLSKPIFILGLILTILPSCIGIKNSFFNTILTAKVFSFIARISFCTYLIHIFVLSYWIATRSYDVYYTFWDIFTFYSGILVLVLFFGFLITVCIELPFSNLLKNGMQKLMKKNEDRGQDRKKGESILTTI